MKSSNTTGTSVPHALEEKKYNRENNITPDCNAKKEKLVNLLKKSFLQPAPTHLCGFHTHTISRKYLFS